MHGLGARQLQAILDEVEVLGSQSSMSSLRELVPDQLMRLVRCDRAGWVTINRSSGVMSGVHRPEMLPHVIALMPRDLSAVPIVTELLAAEHPTSLRISDLIPHEEWVSSALCRSVYAPLDGTHQIGSLVAADDELLETITVFRGDDDFTDDELQCVERFARHVRVALTRIGETEGRAAADLLTGRQRQVLAALASGVPTKRAAWELGISEKTVENHLDAIYRRLGVTGRAAALRRLRW